MLNQWTGMGRLTADPELKQTQNGVPVTSFTLAVDRDYSGQEKKTDFVNCVAWRNTAEFIAKYFTKGKLMAVRGELQSRSYENQSGNKVTVWEIIVSNAYFGGDKSNNDNTQPASGFTVEPDEDDEGLPF